MAAIAKLPKINDDLTRRVTELHSLGYDHDFVLFADSTLLCLQSNVLYLRQAALIRLVDQVYDCICRQFRYVYTVESETGEKGILVLSDIAFDAIADRRSP
jgi:hypothetical protein